VEKERKGEGGREPNSQAWGLSQPKIGGDLPSVLVESGGGRVREEEKKERVLKRI